MFELFRVKLNVIGKDVVQLEQSQVLRCKFIGLILPSVGVVIHPKHFVGVVIRKRAAMMIEVDVP